MTTPRKTGRPTKLTPQLQTKICKYIADGNYLSTACQAVGIGTVTFNYWLNRARQEELNGGGIYVDFLKAVKRAESEQEAKIVERLVDAAMPGAKKKVTKTDADGKQSVEITETGGEWLSAATYLERRHPDRWGRRDRHDVNINEKTINITRVEIVLPPGGVGQIIEGEVRELPPGESNG